MKAFEVKSFKCPECQDTDKVAVNHVRGGILQCRTCGKVFSVKVLEAMRSSPFFPVRDSETLDTQANEPLFRGRFNHERQL
jgi:transposase-like protein